MREQVPGEQSFEKTHDYVHEYRGYWDRHTPGGTCRIRVYERAGDIPVVIATELPTNVNSSITNMAEFLAAEIIARHFPDRFGQEQAIRWIEQYPRTEKEKRIHRMPEYAVVNFENYERNVVERWAGPRAKVGQPSWHYISDEEVERLLGQKPT